MQFRFNKINCIKPQTNVQYSLICIYNLCKSAISLIRRFFYTVKKKKNIKKKTVLKFEEEMIKNLYKNKNVDLKIYENRLTTLETLL